MGFLSNLITAGTTAGAGIYRGKNAADAQNYARQQDQQARDDRLKQQALLMAIQQTQLDRQARNDAFTRKRTVRQDKLASQPEPQDAPKPMVLSPGAVVFDPTTRKPIYTAPERTPAGGAGGAPPGPPPPDPSGEGQLRREYASVVKDYDEIARAYRKVESAAGNPSAAGDLSLIFGYMKMLDPGSTVREGEFANAQNAAGIPDQVRNAWNRALNGERLNERQRADFVGQARNILNSQRQTLQGIQDRYRGIAGQYGMGADRIVYDPFTGIGEAAATPGGSALDQVAAEVVKAMPNASPAEQYAEIQRRMAPPAAPPAAGPVGADGVPSLLRRPQ